MIRKVALLYLTVLISLLTATITYAQTSSASPTPTDQRGLGIQSSGATSSTQSPQAKEAKPELVLQTGYNDMIGATRLVFSPDGRLLATASYQSNAIKLWETATSRKLCEFSTGTGSSLSMTPMVAFSRDNRLIA